MRANYDRKIDYMPKKAYENLHGETFETLTVHGSKRTGQSLTQLCLWAGLSMSGTAKQKAERLMEWKRKQQ